MLVYERVNPLNKGASTVTQGWRRVWCPDGKSIEQGVRLQWHRDDGVFDVFFWIIEKGLLRFDEKCHVYPYFLYAFHVFDQKNWCGIILVKTRHVIVHSSKIDIVQFPKPFCCC